MLKFVVSPKPTDLSMCSLAICKGLLLHCWEHAQELDTGWEGSCIGVRCSEQWASWEDTQTRHPQLLIGEPPDGVCDTASRTYVPLIHSVLSPACCSSSCSLVSQPCSLQLSLLNGVREKWDSLAASHTAGEARHSVICSYFPSQKKSQGFPGGELCHLEGGMTQ